jgi:hypothetical protein
MAVKKYRGGGANALSSGQNGEGMEILTGRKSTVSTTPKEMVESLEKLARNPSNTAGVFSFKEGFNDKPRILDRHAFSVKSVDLVSGRVTYCNPWDTSKSYTMGFDEFTRKCDEIALLSFGG